MKRILFAIMLALPFTSFSQCPMPLTTGRPEPEQAWTSQCSTQENGVFTWALDQFINSEIADGNWYYYDRFWIFGTGIQANARISIVNDSLYQGIKWPLSITEVNSPSWSANNGYTGNGSTSYLNSNWNGHNACHFSQNSASVGVYIINRGSTSNPGDMGCFGNPNNNYDIQFRASKSPNQSTICINGGTFLTGFPTSNLGLFSGERSSSSNENEYYDGSSILSTTSSTSFGVPNLLLDIMAINSNGTHAAFSAKQYAMSYIGSSSINQSNLYTNFQAFATVIGFNK